MKKITLGLSAAALAVAGFAVAAEMAPSHDMTRIEAKAEAEKDFDRLDTNHDGKIDQADRAAMRDRHFDKLDANHDGALSRQEFDAPPPGAGGPDGMMPPPGGEMRHDHDGMGHHGEHHGMGHGGMAMMVLHRADPNHTGTVTRAAYVDAALSLFDEADTNHDGVLSKAEHEAAHAKMRAAMKARWGEHHDGDRGGNPGGMGGGDMPPPPDAPVK